MCFGGCGPGLRVISGAFLGGIPHGSRAAAPRPTSPGAELHLREGGGRLLLRRLRGHGLLAVGEGGWGDLAGCFVRRFSKGENWKGPKQQKRVDPLLSGSSPPTKTNSSKKQQENIKQMNPTGGVLYSASFPSLGRSCFVLPTAPASSGQRSLDERNRNRFGGGNQSVLVTAGDPSVWPGFRASKSGEHFNGSHSSFATLKGEVQ